MSEGDIRKRMSEVIELLSSDITSIRTGRATPAIVQDLEVEVYGGQQKLKINELANISSQGAQTIVIEPWDKSIIGEINSGILKANIGLNPAIDGEILRINLPPLTTEDREKFVKLLSKKLESSKIMIRQIRAAALKEIKETFEKKEITEDENFNQEKSLQNITDEYVKSIDEIGENKKQELLQI